MGAYAIYSNVMLMAFSGVLLGTILITTYPPWMQTLQDLESYPGPIGVKNDIHGPKFRALGRDQLTVIPKLTSLYITILFYPRSFFIGKAVQISILCGRLSSRV